MTKNELRLKVQALLFNTRRSRRYHEWRVKFFRRFNVLRAVLAAASTSGALAYLLKYNQIDWVLSTLVAVSALLTILELAIRMGARESLHQDLMRSFVTLERDIVAKGNSLLEEDYDGLNASYIDIEVNEPPVLRVLNRLCYNAEVRARFPEDEWPRFLRPVTVPQRVLASFYDLLPHTYAQNKSNRLAPEGTN